MSAIPAVLLHLLAGTPTQRLRPKEIGHEGTGRACAPWLIALGRSLDVPRLDRVALHHSSFGSDAASAGVAAILVAKRRCRSGSRSVPWPSILIEANVDGDKGLAGEKPLSTLNSE
jgi:hypothetical protein